ncbi:MAG TPA: hypothetical protein ENN36_01525 [Candidatus Bathyarchaeota archaeon]|nr:hypothetical protein [Candidatus Bathyarchaeota archaeon]
MAGKEDRLGHLRLRPKFFHMAAGSFLVTAIIFLSFQLTPKFGLPALAAMGFFNLLFLFLLFPLEGPLLSKTVLLIGGNTVGVLWYLIQLSFEESFLALNTDTFKMIILVAKPLIDFVWIVAVWSLSLSVLASYRTKMEEPEKI